MKKIIYVLLGLFLMSSCQKDFTPTSEDTMTSEISKDYTISPEDALENLEVFLSDNEDSATRASNSRTISSLTPIKYWSSVTRSSSENLNCDNLLYIANFEQEQGYAILAGDSRIQDKVIAITDQGNITDATVYTALELATQERYIIEDYPLTGEGFYTTPETGDEVFMNPNTVSLYDETANDTYVGNFNIDDTGALDDNGNIIEPIQSGLELKSTPELVTSSLCVNYAINEIREYERVETMQPIVTTPIGGGNSSSTRTEVTATNWSVKQQVTPILKDYADWHQQSPFNDLSPVRRKLIVFGKQRKAPAGCFPLAISKILTHFEHPNTYTFNGYTIDWSELKKSYASPAGKLSAAHLLRGISSACNSLYFYEGTFTFPSEATKYMDFIGLDNAHSYNYSFDRVTEMIDDECPIIIYSVPGINVFISHSWNIDGYKIKERTITTKTYNGNTLKSTTTATETSRMVHCDFGWGGYCNGYYVSGVFKLNDPNIEHDPGTSHGGSTHYNNLLKVITYDKPY